MLGTYYLTLPAQHKQILLSCPLLNYKGLNILTLTGHLIIYLIGSRIKMYGGIIFSQVYRLFFLP